TGEITWATTNLYSARPNHRLDPMHHAFRHVRSAEFGESQIRKHSVHRSNRPTHALFRHHHDDHRRAVNPKNYQREGLRYAAPSHSRLRSLSGAALALPGDVACLFG